MSQLKILNRMVVLLFLLNHGEQSYRQKEAIDSLTSKFYTPAKKELINAQPGINIIYYVFRTYSKYFNLTKELYIF